MNMKDQRFTELLNLHLDHELTPVEAIELEAELQRDPARRRQFREFSRMQRACAQLFEREHARAPASLALERALRDAERKVAAPASRPFFGHPLATAFAGFATMAACVAFVVLRSNPVASVQSPGSNPVVASHQTPSAPDIMLASYNPVADDYQPVLVGGQPPAGLAAAESGHGVADWVQGVELPELPPVMEGTIAENAPGKAQPAVASQSSLHSLHVNTEFVGFQFQR
jgi:anti-sigma factor RsiW